MFYIEKYKELLEKLIDGGCYYFFFKGVFCENYNIDVLDFNFIKRRLCLRLI